MHRGLILEGNCDKAPGQNIKQYIYQLAEYIQLKPAQATKIHLVDSINVHSNMNRVIVYFLPRSYIEYLSNTKKNLYISTLV